MINDPIAQRLGWESVNPYPTPLTEAEVISRLTGFGNAFINDVSSGRVQFADDAARSRFDTALQRRNDYAVTRPSFGGDAYGAATASGNDFVAANPSMFAASLQSPLNGPVSDVNANPVPTPMSGPTTPQTASQGLLAPLASPDLFTTPTTSPITMMSEPLPRVDFDPRSAELAGVDNATYGQFLSELQQLNQQAESGQITQQDYSRGFLSLADNYGVNTVVRDGDRVLYLNPGSMGVAPDFGPTPEDRDINPDMGDGTGQISPLFGQQSIASNLLYPGGRPHDFFVNEPIGSFIGDTRTRNESNFMRNLTTGLLNTGLNIGLGTLGSAARAALPGLPFAGGEGGGVGYDPRGGFLEAGNANERYTGEDGRPLSRSESADAIMRDVLAGILNQRERFEIPAVENTAPETIEFPIDMPRLPVEAEETQTEAGGGAESATTDQSPAPPDTAPMPPEDVFGQPDNTVPDDERRWRYEGGGIFVNIDTGTRTRIDDDPGTFNEGELYSGPTDDVTGEDDIFAAPFPDTVGGGSDGVADLFNPDVDGGIDFGPFPSGVVGGAGSGSGTGDGDGDGEGDGKGSEAAPTPSTTASNAEYEKLMAQVRYEVTRMQRADFVLQDYLATLLGR